MTTFNIVPNVLLLLLMYLQAVCKPVRIRFLGFFALPLPKLVCKVQRLQNGSNQRCVVASPPQQAVKHPGGLGKRTKSRPWRSYLMRYSELVRSSWHWPNYVTVLQEKRVQVSPPLTRGPSAFIPENEVSLRFSWAGQVATFQIGILKGSFMILLVHGTWMSSFASKSDGFSGAGSSG